MTDIVDDEAPCEEEPTIPTWPPDGRTGDDWWMVWLEDRPNTPMEQVLGEAIAHFAQKYGLIPNRALGPLGWPLVNDKGETIETIPQFPHLLIRTTNTVQKGHVWLTYAPEHNAAQPQTTGA